MKRTTAAQADYGLVNRKAPNDWTIVPSNKPILLLGLVRPFALAVMKATRFVTGLGLSHRQNNKNWNSHLLLPFP